ncbi:MAG: hypothetical protein HY902_09970 [Deltaproteobacteria bacterium]|nr:hypothetical protein [Deltaproteobacteria bacterium]
MATPEKSELGQPLATLPATQTVPASPAGDGVVFEAAGRQVQIARSPGKGQWHLTVDGKELPMRFAQSRATTTNSATYHDPETPLRPVRHFPLPGADLSRIETWEVRPTDQGLEAKTMWGGRLGEVAGTVIYEYYHLRLVFPGDFRWVAVTFAEDTDTSA